MMGDMVITVFRSRLRPEHREEYERWAKRTHDLAVKTPGFISVKTFAAAPVNSGEIALKLFLPEYILGVCQASAKC